MNEQDGSEEENEVNVIRKKKIYIRKILEETDVRFMNVINMVPILKYEKVKWIITEVFFTRHKNNQLIGNYHFECQDKPVKNNA